MRYGERSRDTEPHTKENRMDPKACEKRIEDAKKSGDKSEERAARQDLRDWRNKGGF